MDEQRELTVGFGPVGRAGSALLLLGILKRSRLVALLGLGGVVADVTVAELGGFKAMNETRPVTPASAPPLTSRSALGGESSPRSSPCTRVRENSPP